MGSSLAIYILFVWIIVLSVGGLRAQGKPEAPPREVRVENGSPDSVEQASDLPKFDLPEFDITGQARTRLDNASKGTTEEPWETRGSAIGNQQRESVTSLGNPSLPGTHSAVTGFTGRADGGYGSFDTPFLNLWLGVSSPSSGLLFRSGYKSSDGHLPNADYREGLAFLSGNVIPSQRPAFMGVTSVRADVGYRGAEYRLYGSPTPERQRDVRGVGGDLSVRGVAEGLFDYQALAEIKSFSLRDVDGADETEFGARLEAERTFNATAVEANVALHRDSYSSSSSSQGPFFNEASFRVYHPLTDQLQLMGGLALYVHRGSEAESKVNFYPAAGISWAVQDRLTLFASVVPHVERTSLSRLVGVNPYLEGRSPLHHPQYSTDAALGAAVETEIGWKGSATMTYQRVKNLAIFVESATGGTWDAFYDGTTRLLGVEGEASGNLGARSNLSFSIRVQGSRNSATGRAVPYTPTLRFSAYCRYKFPSGISIEPVVRYVGSQFANLEHTAEVPSYFQVDVKTEYEILPRFAVGVTLGNVLNQKHEQWRGYRGIPRNITASARYSW
jgi:hypothetical protein